MESQPLMQKVVREATHAGSWYNDESSELDKELETNLENAENLLPKGKTLKAIIGPHAGYRFSGPTMAWAYKTIDPTKYDRIFLLGPSHKVLFDFAGATTCSEWETPLGNIPIDCETVKELCEIDGGKMVKLIEKKAEENEHSLEMHIPFIRKVFGKQSIKMVPLMIGYLPREKIEEYGKILTPYFLDERTLFVVSTDFCHWGKRFSFTHQFPDEEKIYKSIERLDKMGAELIEK